MYPAKKIEIGNEKGQLVEMIIIDHNQDSLTYKFNYDNRELLYLLHEIYNNEIKREYRLKYNIYE